jgi:hypothetical protein
MKQKRPGFPEQRSRSKLSARLLGCAALLLAMWPALTVAQNRNAGEIRGTVLDATGAAVPDVTVTLTNTLTGVSREVKTGPTGVYDAISIDAGTYSIAFSKEGFKKYVRSGVDLHVETITVDAVLELGSLSQEVTVAGAAPLVQTETSERRSTLTTQAITELPNVGRGWYSFTGLLPGVNGGRGNDASGEGIGVNGTTSYQANWLIDGGVGTYPVSQNPDELQVPLDAISEISFSTSNFSAEYGTGVAVFNVITKSGTNQFHGSLFEFIQNDAFMARNFFQPKVPPLRWNQYGGTIGGPIKRDKAFFFFSYQRKPTTTYTTGFYTYPTAAMRSGDLSAPGLPVVNDPASLTQQPDGTWTRTPFPGNQIPTTRFDPVSKNIMGYLPNPTSPGIYNNLYFSGRHPVTFSYYNAKVDYNISSGNRLTGSVMYVPWTEFSPHPNCPMDCTDRTQSETQGQVTDVWTISPSLVNEFRSSVIRTFGLWKAPNMGQGYPAKLGLKNAQADAFPGITIGGAVPSSISGGLRAMIAFNSYVQSNTLTYIKGKHILKFGGEFDKWQQNMAWDDRRSGNFSFSGIFTRNPSDPKGTGLGFADFVFGLPSSWSVYNPAETGGRSWNTQLFVQDDYKIRPNLTLNLGVRYQVQAGWSEQHDRLALFDPTIINPQTGTPGALWFGGQNGRRAAQKTIKDFFAPRIGFAWVPRNRWSVRGGYGIFSFMWGANTYGAGLGNGWSVSGAKSTTDLMTPIFTLADGPPLPVYPSEATRKPDMLNGQGVTYFPYDTPMNYVHQWHFDIQREIVPGLLADVGYVQTRGIHMGFSRDINQVPAHLLGPGDAQKRRPYPQYLGIGTSYFDGISKYHSLQVSIKKQFSNGFSVLTNYTFSKTLDTGTGSGWGGSAGNDGYQNAYNWRDNYALSQLDSPHMWNGMFIYELPVGKGKRLLNQGGIANALIGGWQLSSTFQVHSGIPFTPLMGTANLSGALAGNWRPNRIGSGKLSNPTIQKWFDTSAFVQPAPYTFGNSGRNILRGPSYKNMHLSMAKNFHLPFGEQTRLQLRGDAYNVFNHPNFALPNASIGTPGAGIISAAEPSRNLQLGARISF